MNAQQAALVAAGWVGGIGTALFTDYLKRALLDRSRVRVEAFIASLDLPGPPAIEMFVSAVNTRDVPVVIKDVVFNIWNEKDVLGGSESDGLTRELDLPVKLQRHEALDHSVVVPAWINDYLDIRMRLPGDHSPVDFGKLRFEVSFIETTGRRWTSRQLRLNEAQVESLRREFGDPPQRTTSA